MRYIVIKSKMHIKFQNPLDIFHGLGYNLIR